MIEFGLVILMFGIFGSQQFGSSWHIPVPIGVGGNISVVGDSSSHGGSIISSNQDGTLLVGGVAVAVAGAILLCPIHGPKPITPTTVKSFCNGKLILTNGAIAGCGALIISPDRSVYVE